jgi:hypothetical protein
MDLERTERQTGAESWKTSLGPPSTRSTLEEVRGPRVAVYKRTENGPIVFITMETASHLNSCPLLDRIVEQDVLQNSGKARLWADSPPYFRIVNRMTRYSLGRIKIL